MKRLFWIAFGLGVAIFPLSLLARLVGLPRDSSVLVSMIGGGLLIVYSSSRCRRTWFSDVWPVGLIVFGWFVGYSCAAALMGFSLGSASYGGVLMFLMVTPFAVLLAGLTAIVVRAVRGRVDEVGHEVVHDE